MPDQQYSRIQDETVRDSLELESLASSGEEESSRTPSSRGLSPMDSPIFEDDDDLSVSAQQHGRTLSVSTIGDHLFSLSATTDLYTTRDVPLEKQKRLSLLNGLSLVIGLQIGSGIFASPSQINKNAGSVATSLMIWVIAGLLAWTGASSFAELGSAIPLNGSSQAYLNHIFGPLPSFLFSWTALTVLKPGGAAIIAIIFGEYFAEATTLEILNTFWMRKVIAISGLIIVTSLNCFSTHLGARAGDVFLVLKVSLLVTIAVMGFVSIFTYKGPNAFDEGIFEGASTNIGDYAIALYAGLWAYDGWDNVNYVAAEMKNARRDIPRVIHIAMPVVIVCYILANVSYYLVLSKDEVLNTTTVAILFATKLVGKAGGIIFAVLISMSCIGALNATTFSSSRLVYSSAKEQFLPEYFARIHPKTGTPVNALLLQATMTLLFIIVGEFHTLLTFYGIAGYTFYFLTVFGVFILRIREPDLNRPYKTFITTPIMFCCVALFLVSRTIFEKPAESLYAILFIISGIPIYMWKFGFNWSRLNPLNISVFHWSRS